uniref:Wsv423-like protein n=1 Tax=Metapenaeus ensis majanivirus TaxID=2984279 RepID=A0A9C7C8K8_9VIRU|nr:MAG: wsv423-like protein [Metapenaeus ensis majanivirus]
MSVCEPPSFFHGCEVNFWQTVVDDIPIDNPLKMNLTRRAVCKVVRKNLPKIMHIYNYYMPQMLIKNTNINHIYHNIYSKIDLWAIGWPIDLHYPENLSNNEGKKVYHYQMINCIPIYEMVQNLRGPECIRDYLLLCSDVGLSRDEIKHFQSKTVSFLSIIEQLSRNESKYVYKIKNGVYFIPTRNSILKFLENDINLNFFLREIFFGLSLKNVHGVATIHYVYPEALCFEMPFMGLSLNYILYHIKMDDECQNTKDYIRFLSKVLEKQIMEKKREKSYSNGSSHCNDDDENNGNKKRSTTKFIHGFSSIFKLKNNNNYNSDKHLKEEKNDDKYVKNTREENEKKEKLIITEPLILLPSLPLLSPLLLTTTTTTPHPTTTTTTIAGAKARATAIATTAAATATAASLSKAAAAAAVTAAPSKPIVATTTTVAATTTLTTTTTTTTVPPPPSLSTLLSPSTTTTTTTTTTLIKKTIIQDINEILYECKINFIKKLPYVFGEMINILTRLENQRLVHLDIKPDNFVIDINTGQPYLIDMGLMTMVGTICTHIIENDEKQYKIYPQSPPELLNNQCCFEQSMTYGFAYLLMYIEKQLREQKYFDVHILTLFENHHFKAWLDKARSFDIAERPDVRQLLPILTKCFVLSLRGQKLFERESVYCY